MRVYVLGLLCAIAYTSAVEPETKPAVDPAAAKPIICTPLEKFMEDCNRCTCDATGTRKACTKRLCGPATGTKEATGTLERKTRGAGGTCTPGEVYSQDCNRCTCAKTGLKDDSRCTKLGCDTDETKETCEPGSKFKLDTCNWCTCPKTGIKKGASCTLIACPQHNHKKRSPAVIDACTPDEQFMHFDGCNTCKCPASGIKSAAHCTRMFCRKDKPKTQDDTCEPGSNFKHSDNCNSCICPEHGKKDGAACTAMACISHIPHRDTRSVSAGGGTCEPGSRYKAKDGCNSCVCPSSGNKDGGFCTAMACVAHIPRRDTRSVSGETCEPGSSYKHRDGCNTCVCPANGNKDKGICTKKLCLPPRETKPASGATCEPGSSYHDGCNACICPADGNSRRSICTQKACISHIPHRDSRSVPETCVPNSRYLAPDGCNTCKCPASGIKDRRPACTLKACPPKASESG